MLKPGAQLGLKKAFSVFIVLTFLVHSTVFAKENGEGDLPLDEAGHVCDDERASNYGAQVGPLCQEADVSKKKKKLHTDLIAPWSAVFLICATACVYKPFVVACSIASPLAGAADLIYTLEAASYTKSISVGLDAILVANAAVPSIGTTAGGYLIDGANNVGNVFSGGAGTVAEASTDAAADAGTEAGAGTGTEAGSESTDASSCFSAAMAAAKIYIHIDGREQGRRDYYKYRDEATKFDSNTDSPEGVDLLAGASKRTLLNLVDPRVPGRTTASLTGSGGSGDLGAIDGGTCIGAKTASCARALDRSLPKFVENKKVQDFFKEITGTDYEGFNRKAEKGNLSMAQIASKLANSKDSAKRKNLEKAFKKLERKLARKFGGGRALASYSGGSRAGSRGGSKSGNKSKSSLNFFGRNPAAAVQAKKVVKLTHFDPMIGKTSEEIATDRKISLFYRVGYRHQRVKNRLESLPYLSIYNRATINGLDLD